MIQCPNQGLQFTALAYSPVTPLCQEVPEAEELVLREAQLEGDCIYLDAQVGQTCCWAYTLMGCNWDP